MLDFYEYRESSELTSLEFILSRAIHSLCLKSTSDTGQSFYKTDANLGLFTACKFHWPLAHQTKEGEVSKQPTKPRAWNLSVSAII